MKGKYLRDILKTPQDIINKDGSYNVGIFDTYFKNLNFRDNKRPILRKFLNNQSLTEWQAVEVLLEDVFLMAAVFKFNLINKSLFLLYDRKNKKLYDFSSQSSFKNKSYVSSTLENNSVSLRETDSSSIRIINELNHSMMHLEGYGNKDNNNLEFKIDFNVIANPSVFVFPMTEKNVVYTEKDFLKPEGFIRLNDKTYKTKESDIAILDDHRGYYPLSSGYDWITSMCEITLDGKKQKFGINLTDFYKNSDPENFNENGYWLNEEFIHLPVVHFKRENNLWYIRDDLNTIDLTFKNLEYVTQRSKHIFKIDYMLAIGELSGTIKTYDNQVIKIDKVFSLGEKRVTQFLNKNIY
ncbi:hypothetical protein ACAG96_07500 [Candidatus Izemoplasma sp. B36]|uniref:DUF2804 family protein n=1 Tax=Candidatus Izemoplasma sp. B36 TaxID=3242468 RepID=UPI00355652E4